MFAIVGGILAIGMGLSTYGSQIIIEDLITQEEDVVSGGSLEVTSELDPSISEMGVFWVQIANFQEDTIQATIFDPSGSQIISESIDRDSYEGNFEISSIGTYKLLIENNGQDDHIIGVIGHMPDSVKISVGVTGLYLIIIGLFGMGGLAIYILRNKRKSKFS